MFESKNLYPIVLVPGVVGYGEDTKIHKALPYFGMTSTSYEKVASDFGIECHTASFEVLSGTWDRACELYAQLVGGTVDYGKEHSSKYGHERFGRTYEKPMIENWDKITLVAHGFGAPVARLFLELLTNGSQHERAVTDDSEISDLFKGGNYNKIHAIVTIAGINDGISFAEAFDDRIKNGKQLLTKALITLDGALFTKNDAYTKRYSLSVSQRRLGATWTNDGKSRKVVVDDEALAKYASSEDSIFYDMGAFGFQRLNNSTNTFSNVYYLSLSSEVTTSLFGKVIIPTLKAGITLPTSLLISTYENYLPEKPLITKRDFDNDGFVNTNASLAPITETATAFKDASRCQPGIWYQMPIEKRNHLSYRGLFVRPDKYRNEIFDLLKIICNLETI